MVAYRILSTLGPAAPRTAQPTGAAPALMAGSLLALSWAHLPSPLLPPEPPAQMLQVELLLLLLLTLRSSRNGSPLAPSWVCLPSLLAPPQTAVQTLHVRSLLLSFRFEHAKGHGMSSSN